MATLVITYKIPSIAQKGRRRELTLMEQRLWRRPCCQDFLFTHLILTITLKLYSSHSASLFVPILEAFVLVCD